MNDKKLRELVKVWLKEAARLERESEYMIYGVKWVHLNATAKRLRLCSEQVQSLLKEVNCRA